MIQILENNLIVQDDKGEAVALWRKDPISRKNILYLLKEMSLTDIEKFGTELYINNTAESLKVKSGE